MKTITICLAATLLLVSVPLALADVQTEVEHLLQYVEESGCEFERNGSLYDSAEARSHIEKKYGYISSRVRKTEDFIRYAATGSSISGRDYHVTCDGQRQTSSAWLHEELARYRNSYQ